MRVTYLLLMITVLALPSPFTFGSPPARKQLSKQPTSTKSYAYWDTIKVFLGDSTKNTTPFTVDSRWSISWDTKPEDIGDGNFAIEIHRVADDGVLGIAANVVGASKDETQEYQKGTYYLDITSSQHYTIMINELYDPIQYVKDNGVNVPTHNGEFPIARAAGFSKDTTVVRLLLSKGVAVDGKGFAGQTALMVASRCGSYDIVRLLLSKGANINATDNDGNTPLMHASKSLDANAIDVVRLLLDKGANVNLTNKDGETALRQSIALEPRANIVKALLSKNADVNIRDNTGHTALDWTIVSATSHKEAPEVIELLKAAGASSDQVDENGKHY